MSAEDKCECGHDRELHDPHCCCGCGAYVPAPHPPADATTLEACHAPECNLSRRQHDDAGDVGHAFVGAAPPVSDGGDAAVARDLVAKSISEWPEPLRHALGDKLIKVALDSYAAGLARGRVLGAPESAEQLRARLGWPPLPQAQKRANLEYNLSALGTSGAPAGPPVTGDGDESIYKFIHRLGLRGMDATLAADEIEARDRIMLARGRELENEEIQGIMRRSDDWKDATRQIEDGALIDIALDRMVRCGHRAGTCRSCMEDGAMVEIIEARRAGRTP